jgi:hypothetical protein
MGNTPQSSSEETSAELPVRWVLLASFEDSERASLARIKLEQEQLPTVLDNENAANLLWHLQPAIGGVRVMVPENLLEQAREALARHEALAEATAEEPEEAREANEYDDLDPIPISEGASTLVVCPGCGGTDVEPLTWGYRLMQTIIVVIIAAMLVVVHPLMMLAVLGYAVYFLLMKPTYRCLHCRRRWSD